jgi:mRNA-degrading endonuclease toxin of MazEF toxin-antitoxin module
MQKDFDGWNTLKKNIDHQNKNSFGQAKDIWWCSLGLNIGSEEDGKNELFERPVLILKVFNKNMVRVVPLTSKLIQDENHVLITYGAHVSSTKLSQLKTISTKRS